MTLYTFMLAVGVGMVRGHNELNILMSAIQLLLFLLLGPRHIQPSTYTNVTAAW